MRKSGFLPDAVKQAHVQESLRTWQLTTLILIGVVVMLTCAIVFMVPLKQTKTHFVQFSTSEDVFFKTIPKQELDQEQRQFLVRNFMRQYVDYRETRDHVDQMAERFKTVKAMSTEKAFSQFRNRYRKQKKQMGDVDREVYIVSDTQIADNVHQVEFQTVDKKEEYSTKNLWFATIDYKFVDQRINDDTATRNPLGIKVTDYQISSRDKEIEDQSKVKQKDLFEQSSKGEPLK